MLTFKNVATVIGPVADLITILSVVGQPAPTQTLDLSVSGDERHFHLGLVGGRVVATTNGLKFSE
jgi:hypothetical protein